MTVERLIEKYENKVFILDYQIEKIRNIINNSKNEAIDIEDLKEERDNAIQDKKIYNRFIKELKQL